MELVTNFMNLVAFPAFLATLAFFLPPFYLFKSFLSLFSSFFHEDMANKVVLITGASSGIGEHLAYEYAKRGTFLVLVARRELSLKEVAEKAKDLGSPDVLALRADVAKPDDCRHFIEETIGHFGRLDHLVTNSRIANLCKFEEVSNITKFTPVMDINFWGSVYPTHFAIPHLKKTGGRIVVNSSTAGWLSMPRMSFYNASKAALMSFYETLRSELGSEIGITIVTPGWIESELSKGNVLSKEGEMVVDQEMRDVLVGLIPVIHAETCAKTMVEAACRGDRYVTEPEWFKGLYLLRILAPELLDWFYRMAYFGPGKSDRDAPSKRMLEMLGAKHILYPSSIQTDEVKQD